MGTPDGRKSVRCDIRTPIKKRFDRERVGREITLTAAIEEAMQIWTAVQIASQVGGVTPDLMAEIKRYIPNAGAGAAAPGPGIGWGGS